MGSSENPATTVPFSSFSLPAMISGKIPPKKGTDISASFPLIDLGVKPLASQENINSPLTVSFSRTVSTVFLKASTVPVLSTSIIMLHSPR